MRYVMFGHTYTTACCQDASDQLLEMVLPSGRVVAYGRDGLRRVTSVSAQVGGEPVSVLAASDYRADGLLTGRRFGNGLDEVREYDEQGRLEAQRLEDASEGLVDRRDYGYDASGNLLRRETPSFLGEYAYDMLDRLEEDTRNGSVSELVYDPNGNRLARRGERSEDHEYAAGTNRIETTRILASAGAPGVLPRSTQFIYDDRNRLASIRSGDEVLAEYEYDARGRRTRKRSASEDIVFHYDEQDRLVSETLPDGTPLVDYIHDSTGPVAQIAGDGVSDELVWLHLDHLGTPRAATDETGSVAWRWDGEAFGRSAAQELAGLDLRIRFPGQYLDTETGLHYNYYRYYDPTVGRYVRSDPIGLRGGANTFAYANGNPLRWSDALGLAAGRSCEFTGTCPVLPEDRCGCFAKAFLGWEEAAVAGAGVATAPILRKPRGGIGGGGPSGRRTSIASTAIHKATGGGRGGAGKTARRIARRVGSRFVPGAGTALFFYDSKVYSECLEKCDECHQ